MLITEETLERGNDMDLSTLKRERANESLRSGAVTAIGTAEEIAPKGATCWKGSISVRKRTEGENPELTPQYVEAARRRIGEFYRTIDTSDKSIDYYVRCIDGRGVEGYDPNSSEWVNKPLGPQVPGGTIGQAVAYELALDSVAQESLQDSVTRMGSMTEELGFKPGGHFDDHSSEDRTGCGAIDGVEDHLAYLNHQNIATIETFTRAVLGEEFDEGLFNSVVGQATRLRGRDGYFDNKAALLHAAKNANEDSAPELTGPHNEIALVINLVENTTFDTSAFSEEFGDNVQAFNYDIWHSIQLSRHLFPDDPSLQIRYVHGRVMLAISTAMHLADSSLTIMVRRPHENTAESS